VSDKGTPGVLARDKSSAQRREWFHGIAIIDASLDKRATNRSLADDPRFAASLSGLDHGLHDDALDVFSPQPHTVDALSNAMLSDVVAAWDAFAAQETPRHSALFHFAEHDRVLNDLVSSITRGDAVVMFTGERGVGKTTMCRALVDHLDRRILVSFPGPTTSADYLLKTLLVDFGVISDYETARRRLGSTSREDLLQALDRFLSSLTVLQASALVIIDDAHALPVEVLAELCTLCENAADQRLLQIVLAGEPSLTRLLRKGNLRSLDDRVAVRVEFGSLAPSEGPEYIAHRLAATGKSARVHVDDDALREMFVFSDGLPGALNELCDRAAAMGAQLRAGRVDAEIVLHAAHALGIGTKHGSSARWRDRALLVTLLIVMLVAGALGAGWVFRQPLRRAVTQWRGGDPSTSSTAR
jgi:general secretion pathway protein A